MIAQANTALTMHSLGHFLGAQKGESSPRPAPSLCGGSNLGRLRARGVGGQGIRCRARTARRHRKQLCSLAPHLLRRDLESQPPTQRDTGAHGCCRAARFMARAAGAAAPADAIPHAARLVAQQCPVLLAAGPTVPWLYPRLRRIRVAAMGTP